ncbi:MAG: glycosyltransferase [Vicingus serpentipes]|nr:glycosyltransferase [Vicingus serpentipes]
MSTPQNICFFNTTQFWGGGEKWHFEAAELMSKTDNNTFFVCDGKGELAKKLKGKDISQFHIRVNNRSFLNPLKVNQLIKFYKENKIDVVIFNSPKDLKLGGKAAKKAGVPKIVYRRGIAVEVKKSKRNENLFKHLVTHFIFNSEATKSLLTKNFNGVLEGKKSAVIYNAIEFKGIQQQQIVNERIVIGNAGRLVEQKGQHYLIEIAKGLNEKGVDFEILIAGDGPLHDSLKQEIARNNLADQIKLLGFISDMTPFMNQVDIFVSTALWEGFGFVLAEAMAARKPVLGFDLSSNPELIKDGENGFLIPPKSIAVFVEKLILLMNDEKLRKQMGENAFLFAKENFEKQQQFKKLQAFVG